MFPILFAALQALAQDEVVVTAQQDTRFRGKLEFWRDVSNPDILSHEQIGSLALSSAAPLTFLADEFLLGKGATQGKFERLLRLAVSFQTLRWLQEPISVAGHEYAHVRGYQVAGMDSGANFVVVEDLEVADEVNPFSAYELMFRQMTLKSEQYGVTIDSGDWYEFNADPKRGTFPNRQKLSAMWEAGGLNQQQFQMEALGERVQSGQAQLLDLVMYYMGIKATNGYADVANGDISDYVKDLDQLGVNASMNEVRSRSQWPKLLSGGTLAFLAAIGDYLSTGDKEVQSVRLKLNNLEIYTPEFSSYLTTRGPTLKTRERIALDGQNLDLYFERSYSDSSAEIGIGWKGQLHGRLSGQIKYLRNLEGDGFWLEGGPVVNITNWFAIGAVAYRAEGYTFHRDVFGAVPDFIEESDSGLKLFVEFNFRF